MRSFLTHLLTFKYIDSSAYLHINQKNTVASVIEDDNLWLTQKSLADLFECGVNTVNYHINEIYASNKLDEKSTFRNFRIVQKGGNKLELIPLKQRSLETGQ